MFQHQRMQRALASYNHLPAAERAAMDAHVQTCAECAQRLRAYRAMDDALAALPLPPASPQLRTRFLARMQVQEATKRVIPAPTPRPSLARGLALAGLVAALLLFWGALRWMNLGAPAGPDATISSPAVRPLPPADVAAPTPAPVTDGVLQEVLFSFDMAECYYSPNEWNQNGLLEIQVDRVLLSARDWDVHQSWRVEGRYRSAAGDFGISVSPEIPNRHYYTYITNGDSLLKEGAGDFVLGGHVNEGKADLPAALSLTVFDRESNSSTAWASCLIRLELPNVPTLTPPPRPKIVRPEPEQWRDYQRQATERALHYAPAVRDWIAGRTWLTLPATVPWEYHRPMSGVLGSEQLGAVTFNYLTSPLVRISGSTELSLNLYWRRSEPGGWEKTTVFPTDFVRTVTDRTAPRSFSGEFVWEGDYEMDGWPAKLWRRKLLGRPDTYWLIWYDADADLTYIMTLDARDEDLFDTLLRDFHAENPAQVSVVQREVMSWTDTSPLTWVPPWLTQDMQDVSFAFDPGQCYNPDDAAAPPVDLTLTRVAVDDAEDGVLRWLVEGEYEFPSEERPNVMLALSPADDAVLQNGVQASSHTSVMRTGVGLLPEYRRFAMLTEMQPPADGSLPQTMLLVIHTLPDAPGWQCPLAIRGY